MTSDVMAVCGGGEKLWALLSPDGSYHKLKEPCIFVGRQEDVDLILKSRSVDKKHAVISSQPDQGLYYIHDLESVNGTFVNEKRIHNALLGLSDTVRFGYDMNIFRVDLYPCKENAQISLDKNNNDSSPVGEKSLNNSQDTDTKRQSNHQCCKEPHETTYNTPGESMARICQNCGPKAADKGSMDCIVKGSNLYGQPSWWGWGSSDEEIYTYPNSATLITQPQALSAPPHCTVIQRRRNKTHLQRGDIVASYSTRINKVDDSTRPLQVNPDNPARIQHHVPYSQMEPFTRGGFQESSTPCYSTFDAWESVPPGSLAERIEGSDVKLNDSKNSLSYHIPIVPEFGELPEKPVNDKSSVTRTTTSETSEKTDRNSSTSSLRSAYGDWHYSSVGTSPDYEGRVFGLTEVNIRQNSAHLAEQHAKEVEADSSGNSSPDSWTSSPKGVKVGKPKNSPVKVKTGPRPSTPRSATEKNRVRRGHTSAANEEKPVSVPRDESRGSSSGGSSGPSDVESRGSERCPTTPSSSSTDSEGERNDESPNKHKSKTEKLRKKPGSLALNPGDSPDKTHRLSSSSPSSLPRGNKTAMLRALTSREALKSFVPTSSVGRTKNRHRHSTPAAGTTRKDLSSSEPSSSASLRIWSPGNASTKLRSPSGRCRPSRPCSVGSSSACSLSQTSSRVSSDFETRAAVDAIFDSSSTGTTYALPMDLQMNRNDAKNKTFVLEEKNDCNSSCSTSIETPQDISSNNSSCSSINDTDDKTMRPSSSSNGEIPKTLSVLEDSRLLSRLADPSMNTWIRSQPGKDRCASPDSLLSVAPATSPSPPSTPRSSAKNLREERTNCCSAPPHARRQWDITDKPVEDLMLSSVHAFTVELRLASELVLSKARNLYETDYVENSDLDKGDSFQFTDKKDNQSTMPEWKSSHAEMAGVFRNLRRVEFNLRTMDQALSFLCSTSTKDSREERRPSLPAEQSRQSPRKWKDFKVRARKFSWAEENKNKFPGPPSDEEEVTNP